MMQRADSPRYGQIRAASQNDRIAARTNIGFWEKSLVVFVGLQGKVNRILSIMVDVSFRINLCSTEIFVG